MERNVTFATCCIWSLQRIGIIKAFVPCSYGYAMTIRQIEEEKGINASIRRHSPSGHLFCREDCGIHDSNSLCRRRSCCSSWENCSHWSWGFSEFNGRWAADWKEPLKFAKQNANARTMQWVVDSIRAGSMEGIHVEESAMILLDGTV
jgi:hypothetical protein